MTLRTVDAALRKIDKRTHNAFAMRASLHGIKIPPRNEHYEAQPLSADQEQRAEKAMREAMERKKAEFRRG